LLFGQALVALMVFFAVSLATAWDRGQTGTSRHKGAQSDQHAMLRGWLEMNWVISVSCDTCGVSECTGETTCGLKPLGGGIGETICATQAT
jgi:hypothetical protein